MLFPTILHYLLGVIQKCNLIFENKFGENEEYVVFCRFSHLLILIVETTTKQALNAMDVCLHMHFEFIYDK